MNELHNMDQLQRLFTTLEAQNAIKNDIVANSAQHLHFLNGKLVVVSDGKEITYEPTNLFHTQVAEKLGIPIGYYRRMLEKKSLLLDNNVNEWLHEESKNFLVRTFDDAAENYRVGRAFLSDSYSLIDNYEILTQALEAIKATGVRVEVVGAELSETRMYLKVVAPEVELSGKEMLKAYRVNKERGDGVISGFTLSNSEVGHGAFNIMPRALVLTCINGATMPMDALKKVHLGAKMDELGFNKNQAVMNANRRLIKEQISHAVKVFLSREYLSKLINVYSKLGDPKIEAPVDKVIQVIGKEYQYSEERKANLLKYFIEGGDHRRMGIASAMTREAQDVQDPDVKNDVEIASFKVLEGFSKIEAAAIKFKPSGN